MSRNRDDYRINRDGTTMGVSSSLRNDFYRIQSPHYFALISRSVSHATNYLERIIEEGNKKEGRDGWQVDSFFVKKMDQKEREDIPPTRFRNAITVSKKTSLISFPKPVGILYTGTGADTVAGETQAYFIAPYVSGSPLIHCFEELDQERRINFFNRLGVTLEDYRKTGIYPLDFAPRDIVCRKVETPDMNGGYIYTLVDTEHVAITLFQEATQILIAEQRKEFRREYIPFLSKTKMREALDIVFDSRNTVRVEGAE